MSRADAHQGASRPGASVRRRLLFLALACALPSLLVAVLLEVRGYLLEVDRVKAQTLSLAIAVSGAVDRQLSGYVGALITLAETPTLQEGDLVGFRERAALFLERQPAGANIVVSDRDGQQLFNSLLPEGAPLPGKTGINDLERVIATGSHGISNLFTGLVTGAPRLSIDVPVRRGGQVVQILSLAFDPAALKPLLLEQTLPKDAVITLLDRNGLNIVRLPDRGTVGKPPSASLQKLLAEGHRQGAGSTVTLEGVASYSAYTRSGSSGWTVAIGVPRAALLEPLRTKVALTLAAGLLIVLTGAAYAMRVAGSLVGAVRALAVNARAAAEGETVVPTASGLQEIDATSRDLMATADALRDQQRQLRLVADSVPMLISYIGADLRYRFANRNYEHWMRVRPEEMVGRPVAEIVGDEALAKIRPYIATVLTGRAVEFESWIDYPDGVRRYVHAAYVPHLAEDGAVQGFFATVSDLTGRRRGEERQHLLAREVDHRAKNLLAVVQSVIRLTKAPTYEAFVATLEGRVTALARAHTLLAANRWDGADLRSVVLNELAPYAAEDGDAIRLEGPAVTLRPDATQPVAMAIHELATNAAKYGCLSAAAGRLRVSWSRREADDALRLVWTETGGPAVSHPARVGFGSTLLDASIRRQMQGDVRLDWRPSGLVVELVIPAGEVDWSNSSLASTELSPV
ncbi:MAG TPA: HWE histidine kinase domain-containing protein [Azospirillaceae bacterium]|nr:HWE histidine kinase domain-containing protein [Azospirillaceae bacterium]